MPNKKHAEKAMRQSEKRRIRNRAQRATLRSAIKRAAEVATEGKADALAPVLADAMSKIGKAGKKHLIHPRKASRLESRLQKRVNALVAAGPAKVVEKKAVKADKKK